MGFFKKIKKAVSGAVKSAFKHPLATIAGAGLSYAIPGIGGTLAGGAASHLLSGGSGNGGNGDANGVLTGDPNAPAPEDIPQSENTWLSDIIARLSDGGGGAGNTLLGPASDIKEDGPDGLMTGGRVSRRKPLRGYLG